MSEQEKPHYEIIKEALEGKFEEPIPYIACVDHPEIVGRLTIGFKNMPAEERVKEVESFLKSLDLPFLSNVEMTIGQAPHLQVLIPQEA